MRSRRVSMGVGALWMLLAPSFVQAQAADRIWGRIRTHDGATLEGFVRWDRNEAAWADLLNGTKALERDVLDRVAEAAGEDLDLRGRSVEYLGVRITWEDDGDTPDAARTGVRFGHVAWVVPDGGDAATVGLRSGEVVRLEGGGTDLGSDHRGFVVDDGRDGPVEVEWGDVARVDFGPAPAGARPRSERLYGTVQDRWGDRWTGYVSWDLDEALLADVLDGEDGGEPVEIEFSRIAWIERRFEGGARVGLRSGGTRVLEGTNDVDDGHRGVEVSDPGLGSVTVPWRDVRRVEFASPPDGPGLTPFDGGHLLRGTVETDDGRALRGRIVWDADEAWTWEVLDGDRRGVTFAVEFGRVAEIRRRSSRAAEVVLRDGRTLVLEGASDVDRTNKGIVVEGDDGTFEVVEWRRFEGVRFDPAGSRP